jgi:formamidopyrimidine-DNA glycosylase
VPELPETETIARDLHAMLERTTIESVRVLRDDVLRHASAPEFIWRLQGATILRVWRRAKLIILSLETRDHIVVQPRFTGALLVESSTTHIAPRDRQFITLSATLADGRVVHYRDIRRLGTVSLLTESALTASIAALGPEPLDPMLSAERFSGSLRRSTQAIKKVLMDQRVLAGVGNIYANEACFMAGLDPSRAANSLATHESEALLSSVRAVLTASIAARGTSFRDYVDATGGRGGFVPQLQVYGRGGLPCVRCNATLVDTQAIDGRTTVFCWRCQS